MRQVYMDESGTNSSCEIVVVCGAIINPDQQAVLIDSYLDQLLQKHIPADKRDGFVFHASEIYLGKSSKSIFSDRETWPQEKRWAILDDLSQLPKNLNIPICTAWTNKQVFPGTIRDESINEKDFGTSLQNVMHGTAIAACELVIEKWMRENTKDEFAIVCMENHNELQKLAKATHLYMRNSSGFGDNELMKYFPFTKIRDGLYLASKEESRFLQIADFCSWACRRSLEKAPDAPRFMEHLLPQIYDGKTP